MKTLFLTNEEALKIGNEILVFFQKDGNIK